MLIGLVTEIRTSSTSCETKDEHDGGFNLTKALSSIGILPEPKDKGLLIAFLVGKIYMLIILSY